MVTYERVKEILEYSPVISALANEKTDPADVNDVVFILSGNILTISERVKRLKEHEKLVFVHIDLLEGLANDIKAVDYLYKVVKPHGIISTKVGLLKRAREIGFITVQRIFAVDSLSFHRGIEMIKNCSPHFVEIMPGIIPIAIAKLKTKIHVPIIAGGMISEKKQIIASLNAGALAVSSSSVELWNT